MGLPRVAMKTMTRRTRMMRSTVHMRGSTSGRPAGRTNNSSLVLSNRAAKSRAQVYPSSAASEVEGKATQPVSQATAARQTMEALHPRLAVLRTSIAAMVGATRRDSALIARYQTVRSLSSNSREVASPCLHIISNRPCVTSPRLKDHRSSVVSLLSSRAKTSPIVTRLASLSVLKPCPPAAPGRRPLAHSLSATQVRVAPIASHSQ